MPELIFMQFVDRRLLPFNMIVWYARAERRLMVLNAEKGRRLRDRTLPCGQILTCTFTLSASTPNARLPLINFSRHHLLHAVQFSNLSNPMPSIEPYATATCAQVINVPNVFSLSST